MVERVIETTDEVWDPTPLLAFRKRWRLTSMAMLRLVQKRLPDVAYSSYLAWEKRPGTAGARMPRRPYLRVLRETMAEEGSVFERAKKSGKKAVLI